MAVSSGRVPMLDDNGRFPDRFAPPSVASDKAAAEAARVEAEAAAAGVPAAIASEVATQVDPKVTAAQTARAGAEAAAAGVPAAVAAEVTSQVDPKVTAAQTARTGAETARTGAETARTGAETARTQAQAAQAAAEAVPTTSDGITTSLINNGASATRAALNATYVPKWKADTAYVAGDKVVNPGGDVVSAIANFTSGASYNAANWALPTTYVRFVDLAGNPISARHVTIKVDTSTWEIADIVAEA